jgi:hypothetical protein
LDGRRKTRAENARAAQDRQIRQAIQDDLTAR